MEKEFIPYNEALALKELGFDEPCFATFDEDEDFALQDFFQTYDTFPFHIVAAPTFSQAFRWFRDKYGLSSYVILKMKFGKRTAFFIINELDNRLIKSKFFNSYTGTIYNSYEEAELACLNKLIEIVKNIK